jgi:phosphatidylinositol 4-kinase B
MPSSALSSTPNSAAVASSQDMMDDIPSSVEAQQFTAQQYQSLKRQFMQASFGQNTDLITFQPVSEKASSSRMDTFLRPRLTSVDLNRISNAATAVCASLASGDFSATSEAVLSLEGHSKAARIVSAYPATPDSEDISQTRRVPYPNLSAALVRDAEAEVLLKRYRLEFFHAQIEFLNSLGGISNLLKSLNLGTKQLKTSALRVCLQQLNLEFSRGVYHIYNGICHRIIRIPWKEAFSLNSREKVPYMLFIEVVASEKDESRATTEDLIRSSSSVLAAATNLSRPSSPSPSDDSSSDPKVTLSAPLNIIDEWVVVESEPQEPKTPSIIDKVFGEPWAKRKERIRRSSPVGNQKGWDLLSMIIKAGDDLRQEQLATQLIKICHDIFTSAKLPLWLKPYEVRPTSADGGYLETVHDAISLHTLKEELGEDPSLRNYFIKAYGSKTPQFLDAQRNFVESLAAYSLVCCTLFRSLLWLIAPSLNFFFPLSSDLLQIKDRHNGNILIDREGHLIHIDYGFMLTSSPGSLNFETAPFKLTIEFVEVMGGRNSEMFLYFKHIFEFGFLKLRENARRIISLVEMMLPATKMACFAKGPNTVKELEDRFKLQLQENEALLFADSLIEQSIGNWRTDSYDTYQRYFSGIAT